MARLLPDSVFDGEVDWEALAEMSVQLPAGLLAEAALEARLRSRTSSYGQRCIAVLSGAERLFRATGMPELIAPALSILLTGAVERAARESSRGRTAVDDDMMAGFLGSGRSADVLALMNGAQEARAVMAWSIRLALESGASLRVPQRTLDTSRKAVPEFGERLRWGDVVATRLPLITLFDERRWHVHAPGQPLDGEDAITVFSPGYFNVGDEEDPLSVIRNASDLVVPAPHLRARRALPDPTSDPLGEVIRQIYRADVDWTGLAQNDPLLARQLLYEAAQPDRFFAAAALQCMDADLDGDWLTRSLHERWFAAVSLASKTLLRAAGEVFLATGRPELIAMPLQRLIETGTYAEDAPTQGEVSLSAVELAAQAGVRLVLAPSLVGELHWMARNRPMGYTSYLGDRDVVAPVKTGLTRGSTVGEDNLTEFVTGRRVARVVDPRLVAAAEASRAAHPLDRTHDSDVARCRVTGWHADDRLGVIRTYTVTFAGGRTVSGLDVAPDVGSDCLLYGDPPRGVALVYEVGERERRERVVERTYRPPHWEMTPQRLAAAAARGEIARPGAVRGAPQSVRRADPHGRPQQQHLLQ